MNWKAVALVALVAVGAYQHQTSRPVHPPAGVLVAEAPLQRATEQPGFDFNGHQLQPSHTISLQARVLGVETYRFDREASLSPVDLALGWGPMSNSAVLEHIDISQSGRFYFWRAKTLPVPQRDIERSSANMHMIPADKAIERQLKAVRVGQVVRIEGWLVEARGPQGLLWRSSLTRDDTGAGACELIFVRQLHVL
ncbi:MAG: hypothetical protein MUF76_10375 [Hydrogenophaga sp.]|nr:hypothetical protein [Hydrogenophaga sp.]